MHSAIILHGMPSKEEYFDPDIPSPSNQHWLPWVQKQLILNGILSQTPEFSDPYEPDYQKWLSVFHQFSVNEETILIGHSTGAGFIIRWLTENNIKVGKVVLVAPFLDPYHDEIKSDIFKFETKKDLSKQTDGLYILYSSDDHPSIAESVKLILAADKSIKVRQFENKGHFTENDLKTDQFPELLEVLLK